MDRAQQRARSRYDKTDFTAALLADLIKDGLVPEGKRVGNRGRRPQYAYGTSSYRRALQIARLRHRGIINRDETRLMLSLAGYGAEAQDIRAELERVYVATGRKLLAQLRSGYFKNTKAIPPNQRGRLIARMGPLDESLDAAGLRVGDDDIITSVRGATQRAVEPIALEEMLPSLFREPFVEFAMLVFGGFLNLGELGSDAGRVPGTVQHMIRVASATALENARTFHRIMALGASMFGAMLQMSDDPRQAAFGEALQKLAFSIRRSPAWASMVLVIALRFQEIDPSFGVAMEFLAEHLSKYLLPDAAEGLAA